VANGSQKISTPQSAYEARVEKSQEGSKKGKKGKRGKEAFCLFCPSCHFCFPVWLRYGD
jgi:hypothetical protein